MDAETILKELEAWANRPDAFLQTRNDYGKGYKDGFKEAKSIVLDFIGQLNQKQ